VRVLVTGAGGFVGGALARKLRGLDHEVRALVRPGRARTELEQRGVQLYEGDLGDPNAIATAAAGCEVLFHCAGESARHAAPEALSWINVAGTENVLGAARHAGVARVVHLSCADVTLANRDRLQWREDAVLGHAPLGEWARSKLLAEELALQASDTTLTVTALRPAWLWGPDDTLNLPVLCQEAARGGVRLFGNGQNLFATTYIDNAVDALVKAAHAPAGDVGGRAFHVADAEFHTAREFFDNLCRAVGLPAPRAGVYALSYAMSVLRAPFSEAHAIGPDDVARRGRGSLLDCLRAIQTLAYEPKTNLETGLAALATWASAIGGPSAIAALARKPAGAAEIAHHRRMADEPS
jgi:nucleoside-diphosphate-sugar epimerase